MHARRRRAAGQRVERSAAGTQTGGLLAPRARGARGRAHHMKPMTSAKKTANMKMKLKTVRKPRSLRAARAGRQSGAAPRTETGAARTQVSVALLQRARTGTAFRVMVRVRAMCQPSACAGAAAPAPGRERAHLVKSSGVRKASAQQTATTPAVATSAVSTACGARCVRALSPFEDDAPCGGRP